MNIKESRQIERGDKSKSPCGATVYKVQHKVMLGENMFYVWELGYMLMQMFHMCSRSS